jgi:isopenicillin N synthase-like dioxygenase
LIPVNIDSGILDTKISSLIILPTDWNQGIFYISNFSNIPASDIDAQFSLAKAFFDLPFEEKIQFHAKKFCGGYLTGLKKEDWPSDGAPENVQIYMMPRFEGCDERHHPKVVIERVGELEGFMKV